MNEIINRLYITLQNEKIDLDQTLKHVKKNQAWKTKTIDRLEESVSLKASQLYMVGQLINVAPGANNKILKKNADEYYKILSRQFKDKVVTSSDVAKLLKIEPTKASRILRQLEVMDHAKELQAKINRKTQFLIK